MADQVPWDRKKNIQSMESESQYHPEMDFNEKIKGFLGMGSPKGSAANPSPSPSMKSQVAKKIYNSGE